MTKHPDARCYFAQNEGSDDVRRVAYCGPVRHYIETGQASTKDTKSGSLVKVGEGVWDTYRFEAAAADDGTACRLLALTELVRASLVR